MATCDALTGADLKSAGAIEVTCRLKEVARITENNSWVYMYQIVLVFRWGFNRRPAVARVPNDPRSCNASVGFFFFFFLCPTFFVSM